MWSDLTCISLHAFVRALMQDPRLLAEEPGAAARCSSAVMVLMLVSAHTGCRGLLLQKRVDRILSVLLCSVIRRSLAVLQVRASGRIPADAGEAMRTEVTRRLQHVVRQRQTSEGEATATDDMLPDADVGSVRSVTPVFPAPPAMSAPGTHGNRPRPHLPILPAHRPSMEASFEEYSEDSETELNDMSVALLCPESPGGHSKRDGHPPQRAQLQRLQSCHVVAVFVC